MNGRPQKAVGDGIAGYFRWSDPSSPDRGIFWLQPFLVMKNKKKIKQSTIPIKPDVAVVFDSYPEEIKSKLMFLRQLIFETAASMEEIGEIEEALKWGEPSYLTPKSKSGSTIRIAWKESQRELYSMFFKCTANLVPAFKERFPGKFKFGGNRSIDFKVNDRIPVKELKQCIALALTYHRNKKLEASARWKMVERDT